MMNMLKFEFLKLYSQKIFIVIFSVVVLFNGFLVYNNAARNTQGFSPIVYKRVYQDLSGYTNQEKLKKLQDRYDEIQVLIAIANIKDFTKNGNLEAAQHYLEEYKDKIPSYLKIYENGNYLKYSNNIYAERQIIGTVLNEINTSVNYDKYLQDIDEKAAILSSSSLFSKPGTFSYRNIKATPAAFAPLKGTVLKTDIPDGIIAATQSDTTDMAAVLLILLTCISLVIPEKENNLYTLTKPNVNGKSRTITAKISAAFLLCILIESLLYGTNFIVAGSLFGFGDTGRMIQSVTGFIGCPYVFTVSQYFIIYLLTKLAAYFLISLIVLFLCVSLRKSTIIYAAVSIIMGISFALYISIDPQSRLSFFKQVNLVPFLEVTPVYREYTNINLFSYPVNIVIAAWIVFGLSALILSILTIFLFCRQSSVISNQKSIAEFISNRLRLHGRYTVNLLGNELYKQFIGNKVFIVLMLFVIIQGYSYSLMQYSPSPDEQFYRQYMNVLQGPLTSDKVKYINQEQDKLNSAAEGMQKLGEDYAAGKITIAQYTSQSQYYQETLQRQQAFTRVKEQEDYIMQQQKNGKNPYFIYDTGYRMLSAADGNRMDLASSIKICLALVICISSIFAGEYFSEAIYLIHVCKNGRGKTFVSKVMAGLIIMLPLYFLTYFTDIYFVFSHYGTVGINAPACSLNNLSQMPRNISILQYFLLVYAVRIFASFMALLLIIAVSLFIKNSSYTMASSTAILVVPAMICFLNAAVFEKIPFTSLFEANVLFTSKSLLTYTLCFSMTSGILLFIISYRKFCSIQAAASKYNEKNTISLFHIPK